MNLSEIISKYDTPGEKFYESVLRALLISAMRQTEILLHFKQNA